MRVITIITLFVASVAPKASPEPIAKQKPAEICEDYARLLSSSFWLEESRRRAELFLEELLNPLTNNVRLLLTLGSVHYAPLGLMDGTIGLLELARAHETLGCATAGTILARLESQCQERTSAQMLKDFAKHMRAGDDLDKYAPKLIMKLSILARDIEQFEYQQDSQDFAMKDVGERMMQASTAAHKAKGTLKHIVLSARQYVGAVHADYLIRRNLGKIVLVKSSGLRDALETVNAQISSDYLTYAVVEVKAAQQWDTISFRVTANGQPISVTNCNIKGGEETNIAFPITGNTSVDLTVFNGLNCKSTNWLPNRFSATISFLRRTKNIQKQDSRGS